MARRRKARVPMVPATPAPAKKRAVPPLQRSVAASPERPERDGVSPPSGLRRAPQAEAFGKIATQECRDRSWGYRHVVVGSSGSGKTWWSAHLARATIAARVADVALIHDGKDPDPQRDYREGPHAVYATVGALAADPDPEQVPPVVIFHSRDRTETPDGVTSAAQVVAESGVRPLVVIDEVYDAMKARQTFVSGTEGPTSEIFRKGRSRGISIIAGTQVPQTLPTDTTDLADTIALGRLKRRSLNYIERTWDLDPEMVRTIRGLQRGEFVLLDDAAEWDRTIYGPT